uniref:Serpentine receptor class gamma n=1 Tax=Caenorhabditis japonica TaxID=281687 RepID=A0A8R1HT05_CAEJA
MPSNSTKTIILLLVSVTGTLVSLSQDALSDLPIPNGATRPDTILRPSLLFYLTPFVIALLIHRKNIVPDIRLMYGN